MAAFGGDQFDEEHVSEADFVFKGDTSAVLLLDLNEIMTVVIAEKMLHERMHA